MRKYRLIKLIIYIITGILVIVFRSILLEHSAYVVGSFIILYGLDIVLQSIIRKDIFKKTTGLPLGVTNIIIGVILYLWYGNIQSICIVWAIWSILREGVETQEALGHREKTIVTYFNFTESLVVIVLSIILAIHPSEEHVYFHLLILGLEQIFEVLFPVLDKLALKYNKRVRKEKEIQQNEANKEQ